MDLEFTVKVKCGDVFINGEFVSQLCWDNDSIGYAITNWLNGNYDKNENEEDNNSTKNRRKFMNTKLTNILNSLSTSEKDELYRALWLEYVKEDIRNYDESLDEGAVEVIASRYVYDVDYDCNLSYWDNIENLIEETR